MTHVAILGVCRLREELQKPPVMRRRLAEALVLRPEPEAVIRGVENQTVVGAFIVGLSSSVGQACATSLS